VPATAKKHAVSEQTLYLWRKKSGTLEASDVKRLKQLEQENSRLKTMVAKRDLELEVMKEINATNDARSGAQIAGELRE
jgi:putative transposase